MNQPPAEPPPTDDELAAALARLAEQIDDARTATVKDLQLRWSSARLRVLVVGEAKRGKSTVGNAILRREVLPTGVTPLTAVATTVKLGSPERVEVHQLDGTVVTAPLSELARYVTEAGNPGNEREVADVVVHLASGLPHPSMELVDTPGVGSVYQHNTDAAQTAMTRMDLAVFVLSADPPISAAEQTLLARVGSLSARTFVILNKVDQLDLADRVEAERFTRDAASVALDIPAGDVTLFNGSARQAVRSNAAHDAAGWVNSGMAAFTHALQEQLNRSWRTDLAVSIARSARRVVSELIDEAALTSRAQELSTTAQASEVAAFARCLDGLAIRREDASAVATAHLTRWRALLDTDAEKAVTTATVTVHQQLDDALSGRGDAANTELEATGWTTLTDLIISLVQQWRQTWTQSLTEAASEATRRQQQLLDEAFTDVRAAAATLLGVDLAAPAPRLPLPDPGTFRFDVSANVGWDEPVSSAVRRRLPGALGRRRMTRYLNGEATRLVDKHIGRARSDFQARMQQLVQDLRTTAATSYTLRQRQLQRALDVVQQQLKRADDAHRDGRMSTREGQLQSLAQRFDLLLASAGAAGHEPISGGSS